MNDIEYSGKIVQIQRRKTYVLSAEIQSGQLAVTLRCT